MSKDNDTKNSNDALGKLDLPAVSSENQLGQLQYSFFVDQVANTVGSTHTPSVAMPSVKPRTNKSGEATAAGEKTWVHPSDETRLNEAKDSSINLAFNYHNEFAEKCVRAAAAAGTATNNKQVDEFTFAGAVERQMNAGFSAHFNFRQSVERIFNSLDGNGDRKLSKDELDRAYADGRFTGDDELLLILLLRNLNDMRSRTGGSGARDLTYEDIVSYPGWRQYSIEPETSQPKKFLRQKQSSR